MASESTGGVDASVATTGMVVAGLCFELPPAMEVITRMRMASPAMTAPPAMKRSTSSRVSRASPWTRPKSPSKSAAIEALREFNGLIGSWRGVGQVKRGSTEGSWQEKADLVWELKPKSTGIRINVDDGKEWKTALLTYDDAGKVFTLIDYLIPFIARFISLFS